MPVVFLLMVTGTVSSASVDVNVDVGFSGWVTLGKWMPLRVEVAAGAPIRGEVAVDIPIGQRGTTVASYRQPLDLGPGARQRFQIEVIVDDPRRPLVVRVSGAGRELIRRIVPLGTERAVEGVVAALTHEAAGLEFLAGYARKLGPAYVTEEQLPVRVQGYAGVDLLVIRDLNERRVLPSQRQALQDWVAQGGRLLVTGGDRLAFLQTRWLLDLLPALPGGTTRELPPQSLPGLPTPITIADITARRGTSVRIAHGAPVAAQWRRGRGMVTVWAFDAFAPSMRAWPGRAALWSALLDVARPPQAATPDLTAVLPSAQPLPGRAQAGVATLAALYVLAVRFVLKRWSGYRGWLSVGAVIAAFGVLMYGFATGTRGSSISLAQLSVVEAIPDVSVAPVTTYAVLINPYGGRYRIRSAAGSAVRPLEPVPLTYRVDGTEVVGEGPPRALPFEIAQVELWPLRGSLRDAGREPELRIEGSTALALDDPVVYLGGRIYHLPAFAGTLSTPLDPAKWEVLDRKIPPAADVSGNARLTMYTQLDRMASASAGGRPRPWFVAWMRNAAPTAELIGGHTEPPLRLIVMPLETP